MSTKPRSVRLNKGHRQEMVREVMKRWDETHPKPPGTNPIVLEFIARCIDNAVPGVSSNLRSRTQVLQRVLDQFRHVGEPDMIEVKATGVICVRVTNDKGNEVRSYYAQPSKKEADEAGIPYLTKAPGRMEGLPHFPSTTSPYFIVVPEEEAAELIAEVDRITSAYTQWREERTTMMSEVTDYLSTFTTTKQLREEWPEMEQYLPPHIADPKQVMKVPARTRSRLNERLGIGGGR